MPSLLRALRAQPFTLLWVLALTGLNVCSANDLALPFEPQTQHYLLILLGYSASLGVGLATWQAKRAYQWLLQLCLWDMLAYLYATANHLSLACLVAASALLLPLALTTSATRLPHRLPLQKVIGDGLVASVLSVGVLFTAACIAYIISYLFELDCQRLYANAILLTPCLQLALFAGFSTQPAPPLTRALTTIGHKLSRFILTPGLSLALVILYGYIGRLLWQGTLPKGKVGLIVSGLGLLVVFNHLLISTAAHDKRHHYPKFYPALLAPLVLLILGLSHRIGDYGLTHYRCLLILIALWMAWAGLFFSLRSQTPAYANLLVLGSLLTVFSIGPWSAANLSALSQRQRLQQLLHQHALMQNNQLDLPKLSVYLNKPAHPIASTTRYLCDMWQFGAIATWFPNDNPIHTLPPKQVRWHDLLRAIAPEVGTLK